MKKIDRQYHFGNRYDLFAALTVLIISVAIFMVQCSTQSKEPGEVMVSIQNEQHFLPLNEDQVYEFTGPTGPMKVQVLDQKVRMLESKCKEQLCVRHGFIDAPGQTIVCLPNETFITIEGKSEFDGVVR